MDPPIWRGKRLISLSLHPYTFRLLYFQMQHAFIKWVASLLLAVRYVSSDRGANADISHKSMVDSSLFKGCEKSAESWTTRSHLTKINPCWISEGDELGRKVGYVALPFTLSATGEEEQTSSVHRPNKAVGYQWTDTSGLGGREHRPRGDIRRGTGDTCQWCYRLIIGNSAVREYCDMSIERG